LSGNENQILARQKFEEGRAELQLGYTPQATQMSDYDSEGSISNRFRSRSPPARHSIVIHTRIVYGLPDLIGAADRRVICREWLSEHYPRLTIYSGKVVDNRNMLPVIGIECRHHRGQFSYDPEDKDELCRFIRHFKYYYGDRHHDMDDVVLDYVPVMHGNYYEFPRTYTLDD
jgi:hypothetical protein